MAVGLRFTDGTITVTVSDGTVGHLTAYQQNNQSQDVEIVSDKAEFMLYGTLSTIQTNIGKLNRLFREAFDHYNGGVGPRVYVERDLGDSNWWRSELVNGVLVNVPETLDVGLAALKIPFQCSILRMNYWEGAETAVPLTNGNGTDNTSGLTIKNHDDAGSGHDNWVSIDGVNDLLGDIPTPAIIKLTNTNASGQPYFLWIGFNATDPANLQHILEAEDAVGTTDVSDATCSKAYRVDKLVYSYNTAPNGGEFLIWQLSTSQLNAMKGMVFQPILKFINSTEQYYMSFKIRLQEYATGVILYETEWVRPGQTRIVVFPQLRIPPFLPGQTSIKDIYIAIDYYNSYSSDMTLETDFLQITPADQFRWFEIQSTNFSNGIVFVDDGILGYPRIGDTTNKTGSPHPFGEQIKLIPGIDQKLYFLSDWASDPDIENTLSVKVLYRPRRLVI